MSLEADLLLDRRRTRRSRSLWRALAVLAGLAAALALFGDLRQVEGVDLPGGEHVLRLRVEGTISEDRRLLEAIDRAARNPSVRGLILAVDSPGGTMAGGESLHDALARFRAAKPLVAAFGGTAASAGYMIAMPAERIFAREGSVTGSIGVLLQSFDASEALARLGIRPETLASGALKDQPSPFRPLSEEGRAALRSVVDDLHAQFVGMVAAGRRMPEDRVRALADGRILTGRQAREAGLVDAIGGEAEARAWLAESKAVPASLPVRELETRGLLDRSIGRALSGLMKSVVSEGLGVDGVWALWQPAGG